MAWAQTTLGFIYPFACLLQGAVNAQRADIVTITGDRSLFKVSEQFLSLGMDSNLIRNRWETFDFDAPRLITLAKGLSPAILRLSGTDGDRMFFSPTGESTLRFKSRKHTVAGDRLFPNTNFTMSGADWDGINRFVKKAGWTIFFGLNAQIRNGTQWDPSNAVSFLEYSIQKGYTNMGFELGNEPDYYPGTPYFVHITPDQLGKDVQLLKTVLSSTKYRQYYGNATIVGPDVAWDDLFVAGFLKVAGDIIQAVTWHHYYGGGTLRNVAQYMDPDLLDSYIQKVESIRKVVQSSPYPMLKIWQGETSTTVSPPGTNIDMTYVAGFMLIDKLGLSARLELDLVVRQTFYGFWFALVDDNWFPTPGYWISLLYKRLVGRTVLYVDSSFQGDKRKRLRLYAHCTASVAGYSKGAVTLYGMNLLDVAVNLTLAHAASVDEYLLTPGDFAGLTSRFVKLNGVQLLMKSDTELPTLNARKLLPNQQITVPARSMWFYVLTDLKAPVCQ